ncbi:MAG: 2-oxoglutarate dehydrogenase complex dihydrolipoyllysine-residue succinyltransferase [Gammaproteobacteria bacterium]|nr:2-oxoglutarate dehydrogenase complex dihydrolipoyllysine-residue succinyltransferase [Gammaproteobacteria bacterium]
MDIEIKVPQLPESVTDATLVAWRKQAGDTVQRDETLVDLETDKVVLEVPAPADGVMTEILVQDGATVASGDLLAKLNAATAASDGNGSAKGPSGIAEPVESPVVAKSVATQSTAESNDAIKLSPAVRRMVEEHDIDAKQLRGSGRRGRILKSDVQAFLQSQPDTLGDTMAISLPSEAVEPTVGGRREQRVAMSRLRARIAARMVEAQQSAAMLTTFNEADLTEVIALRKRYKESFEASHGVSLGFMSFFVKASIEGLTKFPVVNASVEDDEIVYHDYFDIGIAVSSERGLLVPVIRNADRLSFAGIESAIDSYGQKARDGSITMDDLTGGTFTITNGGVFGSMLSTPILNPPQSGILGMHKIQERPVVIDGAVVPRPMMYLALTYDHRIVDGREAVQFLVAVKASLEDPSRLLLQV